MQVTRPRVFSFLPFFAVVAMLAYALYAEYYLYLAPCPLCMVQRYIFLMIGILYFIALLYNPTGWFRWLWGGLIAFFSGLGAAVAGRHVWLQSLPPEEVPDCGPGLEYMLDAFPLSEVFKELFYGSGECAESVWSFLGLSFAGWALVSFIGFFIYTIIWIMIKPRRVA